MDEAVKKILKKYPGNEAVYDNLKQLLETGSAIAFLGAGTSVPLYPLWPELLSSRRAWQAEAKRCEGIGRGTVIPIEKIRKALAKA